MDSTTPPLRSLHFRQLDAAIMETRSLLQSGYECRGNWTLGQACHHLRLAQDPSVDGYPPWMSLFAFLRPIMRRWMLPKVLSGDSPKGIRTMASLVPPEDADDATEVEAFATSVDRFLAHSGEYAPHPAFGRQTREMIEQIHCAHAAHHLRFLEPRS